MQPILLKQIYKNLSKSFPQINFAIFTPQSKILYLHSPDQILNETMIHQIADQTQIFYNGITFQILKNGLPEAHRLYLLLPAGTLNIHDVQFMINSMVHQIAAQNNASIQKNSNALFFYHLLHANTSYTQNYVSLLSSDEGYDFSLSRFICILELETSSETITQSYSLKILDFIRNHGSACSQDISGLLSNTQIVICKVISPDAYPLKAYCERIFRPMLDAIHFRFSILCRMGVGFITQDISEYSFCLKAASSALKQNSFKKQQFIFAIDQLPQMLINNSPREVLDHHFTEYIQLLNRHPDWFYTIEALVMNNMDQTAAASSLFLHKNSLIFRLKNMTSEMHLESIQSNQTKFFMILLYYYCQMVEYPRTITANDQYL